MPVGTVDTGYKKHELKSLPDEVDPGYVMLRPLPYGQKLDRQENAMRMGMTLEPDNREQRRGKAASTGSDKVDIQFAMRALRVIEFQYCIGDHNITDANGNRLDMNDPRTLDLLDPKVGTEIEKVLSEINGGEFDDEDFTPALSKSSTDETPTDSTEN